MVSLSQLEPPCLLPESGATEDGRRVRYTKMEDAEQQLQFIKAKTMFEMVEDIPAFSGDGSTRKVMMLTNTQADLLAGTAGSMLLLMNALEIPMTGPESPKVLLDLLSSKGLSNQLNNQAKASSPEADGLNRHKPPFLCDDEERLAEERLDDFMANIIIPLAARTKAIVIVDAFPSSCIL